MRGVCRGTKRDGSPCTAPVTGSNGYCWAHDPAYADKRRRMASRAGKSRPNREMDTIKVELATLYADTLSGRVDKGVAAVGAQIQNVRLRAVEVERKIREQEVLEERLGALESVLKVRGTG